MKAETIFLAVPISTIPLVLNTISPLAQPGQLFIDVASVKIQPKKWMKEILPENTQILNTHPMFGPDSMGKDEQPKWVFCTTRISDELDHYWSRQFQKWDCEVVRMSAREHDRLAARSQGITHYVGRIMEDMGIQKTILDTLGFRQIHHVVEQTCRDTEELFRDLEYHNPQTRKMVKAFKSSSQRVQERMFKPSTDAHIKIGYQGIPGSFSDEAAQKYITKQQIEKAETIPLISSANVLEALNAHEIHQGIIAMENARGGVVIESIHSLAENECRVAEMFHIQVNQCLLVKNGTTISDIKAIYSHPQALKQCAGFIQKKVSQASRMGVEDTAAAARHLAEGKYPENSAVLASARAAQLYDLNILEANVQDLQDNKTLFLVVVRNVENFNIN